MELQEMRRNQGPMHARQAYLQAWQSELEGKIIYIFFYLFVYFLEGGEGRGRERTSSSSTPNEQPEAGGGGAQSHDPEMVIWAEIKGRTLT